MASGTHGWCREYFCSLTCSLYPEAFKIETTYVVLDCKQVLLSVSLNHVACGFEITYVMSALNWMVSASHELISASHKWYRYCMSDLGIIHTESMITKLIVLLYPSNRHSFLHFLQCLFEITTTKASAAAFPLAMHSHVYNINSTCLLLCIAMKKLWQLLICHDVYNMNNMPLSLQH